MALPTNTLATLVSKISSDLQAAAGSAKSALSNVQAPNMLDKIKLDKKINDLSGGIGSSYNWAGTGAQLGNIGDAAKAAQSAIPGAISTAANATAAISNATSDLNRLSSFTNKLTGGNIAGTIQNLAAKVSGAAGQLNNILSLGRAKDIPKGAELFASQQTATELQSSNDNDWRVRIRVNDTAYEAIFGAGNPLMNIILDRGGVSWPYTPSLTLSTKANYTSIETTHSNYPFYAYKNSSVDDISISGEFSCETETDAEYWIAATTFLRTVTKMYFGQGENAGNPPPVCILDGYGSSIFKNVPVIVKSFSVDFREDVNYILSSSSKTWVPILSTVSVTVVPIYNRARLREFDLQAFSRGQYIVGNNIGMI